MIKFSKFQHHGIIFFTEYDLNNFLQGYLPIEALKGKSLSVIKPSVFVVSKLKNNNLNLSKKILLNRKFYLKKGVKDKYYDHHVFHRITPKKGDAYVFPNWLDHFVDPHFGTEERISLSFNLADMY